MRFFPSIYKLRSSTSAPTNERPLSEMMVAGHPWWDAKRRSACRKALADAFSTISQWTALDVAHAKISPHALLDLFMPYLRWNGPNRSTPVTVNGETVNGL